MEDGVKMGMERRTGGEVFPKSSEPADAECDGVSGCIVMNGYCWPPPYWYCVEKSIGPLLGSLRSSTCV